MAICRVADFEDLEIRTRESGGLESAGRSLCEREGTGAGVYHLCPAAGSLESRDVGLLRGCLFTHVVAFTDGGSYASLVIFVKAGIRSRYGLLFTDLPGEVLVLRSLGRGSSH